MTKTLQEKKLNDKYVGVFPFEFSAKSDARAIPDTIHLIPVGQWEHDLYGPILINAQDIREFAQNFNAKIRNGVYITAGHEGFEELPAVGWIMSVQSKDDGLWGTVEWTTQGAQLLSDKAFKFFSPEFYRDYEDPQTHALYRNVITGGALTKSPYFKELEAIVFSEPKIRKQFNETINTMDLQTILAKDITALDDAEKAFVKEHASELSDEQKTAFDAVINEVPADPAPVAEPAPAEPAPVEPAPAPAEEPAPVADPIEASEKKLVQISASELSTLKADAEKGKLAFAELEAKKLGDAVNALVFSSTTNANGRFLPKSSDNLRTFMATLNADQRQVFSTLVEALPKTQIFDEVGAGENVTDGTAVAEVNAKAAEKMKANDKLSFGDAIKQVMSENKGLTERYNEEVSAGVKA